MDSHVTQLHLTDEEIAALAAGRDGVLDESRRTHLSACPTCRAAVDDAAVLLELWSRERLVLRQEIRSFARPFHLKWWRPVVVAAAAAIASLVILVGPSRLDRSVDQTAARLRPALEQTAFDGTFLIPGAEGARASSRVQYRSGFAVVSDEVGAALHDLAGRYAAGDLDGESTAWLVGAYLATGQFGSARDYTDDALRYFADNTSIQIVKALLEYREGEVSAAEARLREVLRVDGNNNVARVDLSLLLADTGRVEEAAVMANRILQEAHEDAIRFRAISLLRSLQSD